MFYIKSRRKKLGLSQAKLAEMSGVAQSTIATIETGETDLPNLETAVMLGKALGCTVEELMQEE